MAAGDEAAAATAPPVIAVQDVTLTLKAAAALVLCVESALGVAIPLVLRNMQSGARWLALLNCFSGGIFLAAGIVHLLPHCAEAQERWHPTTHGELSPLYLIAITMGYLLVLYVERVLFDVHVDGHGHGHGHSDGGHEEHSHANGITSAAPTCDASGAAVTSSSTGSFTGSRQRTARRTAELLNPLLNGSASEGGMRVFEGSWQHPQHPANEHVGMEVAPAVQGTKLAAPAQCKPVRLASAVPMLLAMSVHTFLECMALGLMSSARSFYVLLGAITAHKLVSALALSARFLKEGASPRQVFMYVGPFIFVAPTAILVGSIVTEVNPLAHLLLSCFATGTFLYVGASEVIVEAFEERETRQGRHAKFAALMLGVALIAAAALLPEGHDHSVAGHHHHAGHGHAH